MHGCTEDAPVIVVESLELREITVEWRDALRAYAPKRADFELITYLHAGRSILSVLFLRHMHHLCARARSCGPGFPYGTGDLHQ